MATEQQLTKTNNVMEQESLTGLNLISINSANGNSSKKSTALTEVDPNSVSKANDNASATTESNSASHLKKTSIAEASEEASGKDTTLEAASPGDKDDEENLDDDIGGLNAQMGVGEMKKKRKKRKPKSKRGLVWFWSIVGLNQC